MQLGEIVLVEVRGCHSAFVVQSSDVLYISFVRHLLTFVVVAPLARFLIVFAMVGVGACVGSGHTVGIAEGVVSN